MTADEIMERLRALAAMKPTDRPIPIRQIEDLAGLPRAMVYALLKHPESVMQERTRVRLERALLWVENDQVRARDIGVKGGGHRNDYRISEPRPPQVNVTTVKFTSKGPRVTVVAYNPRTLKGIPK